MKNIPTTNLLNTLENIKNSKDLDEYISNIESEQQYTTYFSDYLQKKNIKLSEVAKYCVGYVSKSYIYEIINGKKFNPNRDILLLICLACKMNSDEIKNTLSIYKQPQLYPKDPRDAVILASVYNSQYDLSVINDTLYKYNLPTIPEKL